MFVHAFSQPGVSEHIAMQKTDRIISSIKAGRNALNWSQKQLSANAQISLVTLARIEAGMATPQTSTISKLRQALESSGVFISDNIPFGGYTMTVVDTDSERSSSLDLTHRLIP